MTLPPPFDTGPALALPALCAGIVLGLAHFALLHRVAALYLGGGSVLRALALQAARLAMLAAFLALLAQAGALPLLAGTLGLLLGRRTVLRRRSGAP
ncbi:ATP synthase subunit I [Poseidonocella sp. HB161398]|uniref:N-ATPase subunit AtpR n=1 Tax=Poseidonocella sp. HB161398 TaxID=2320855 RepID=UPI0011094BBE|nr:ATP synthase subunit I [Poseidonocella sp. HB161398]